MAIASNVLYRSAAGSVAFTMDDTTLVIQTVTVTVNPGHSLPVFIQNTSTGQTLFTTAAPTDPTNGQPIDVSSRGIKYDRLTTATFTAQFG